MFRGVWILAGLLMGGLGTAAAFAQTPSPPDPADRAAYYEAMKLSREGRWDEAVAGLENFLAAYADSEYRDDAAFERARLFDEEKQDFQAAVSAYEAFLRDFSASRLSRRVQRRLGVLVKNRSTGDEPLRIFERLRLKSAHLTEVQVREAMRDLIDRYPEFVLRGEALLWFASYYRLRDRHAEAAEVYEQILREAKTEEQRRQAQLGLAQCMLAQGSVAPAREALLALAATPGYGQTEAQKIAGEASKDLFLDRIAWVAAAGGGVGLAALLLWAWRRKGRALPLLPPWESWLAAGVTGLLAVTTHSLQPSTRTSVLKVVLLCGGTAFALTWLNRALLGRIGPQGFRKGLYGAVFVFLTLAAAFLIFYRADLIDQFLYDLTYGLE